MQARKKLYWHNSADGPVSVEDTPVSYSVVISTLFQAPTSIPFYAGLFKKLHGLSNRIDKGQNKFLRRKMIWHTLYGFFGAPKESLASFTTILETWIEGEKLSLVALEMLYLAFVLTIIKYPRLFKDENDKEQQSLQQLLEPLGVTSSFNLTKDVHEKAAFLFRSHVQVPGRKQYLLRSFGLMEEMAQQQTGRLYNGLEVHASTLIRPLPTHSRVIQHLQALHSSVAMLEGLPRKLKELIWRLCKITPGFEQKPDFR
eukprot:CAMPEP_0168532196 /NCGR_PEP_ID=MMETSP0405-20121227/16044_1 /TAXON_ID=498012 /ORGANISM="Trichosphaerium sp, Strain Am-I-7 wt" /LENGTH=256 /DNA_ID=CAMNT_0008557433 /DNA_START=40 /DNA_END=810 /DNA_ORIENTATION=+